jgi:hypothetical protein
MIGEFEDRGERAEQRRTGGYIGIDTSIGLTLCLRQQHQARSYAVADCYQGPPKTCWWGTLDRKTKDLSSLVIALR